MTVDVAAVADRNADADRAALEAAMRRVQHRRVCARLAMVADVAVDGPVRRWRQPDPLLFIPRKPC